MANLRRLNRPGRVAGSQGYNVSDMTALAKAVELVKPLGPREWSKVRDMYNEYASGSGRQVRAGDALRTKFKSMVNHPKPIDDADCPSYIKVAKKAQRSIEEALIVVLDDAPDDSSDAPVPASTSLFAEGSQVESEGLILPNEASCVTDGTGGETSGCNQTAGILDTDKPNETSTSDVDIVSQNPSQSQNPPQLPNLPQGTQTRPSQGSLPSQKLDGTQPSSHSQDVMSSGQSQAIQLVNQSRGPQPSQSKASQPLTQSQNAQTSTRPHLRQELMLSNSSQRQALANRTYSQTNRSSAPWVPAENHRKRTAHNDVEDYLEEIFASSNRGQSAHNERNANRLYKCLQETNSTMYRLEEEMIQLLELNEATFGQITLQIHRENLRLKDEISSLMRDKDRLSRELDLSRRENSQLKDENEKSRDKIFDQNLELQRFESKLELMKMKCEWFQGKNPTVSPNNLGFGNGWMPPGVGNTAHGPQN